MRLLIPLVFAAGLIAPGVALAQGASAGVQIGPIGAGAGVGAGGVGAGAHVGPVGAHAGVGRVAYRRACHYGWYWHHHHRVCRR